MDSRLSSSSSSSSNPERESLALYSDPVTTNPPLLLRARFHPKQSSRSSRISHQPPTADSQSDLQVATVLAWHGRYAFDISNISDRCETDTPHHKRSELKMRHRATGTLLFPSGEGIGIETENCMEAFVHGAERFNTHRLPSRYSTRRDF